MNEKRASLMIHRQPSVVIVTQCLRDHAFQGNTDVTENTCLHGNVLDNVNVESVLVIQATLPAILYEVPVPVLGALGVENPRANASTLCSCGEYLLRLLKLNIFPYLPPGNEVR